MQDGLLGAIRTGRKGKLWRTSSAALEAYIARQRTVTFRDDAVAKLDLAANDRFAAILDGIAARLERSGR